MLNVLSHAFRRPGNAVLDTQSVGEHWVVRYTEVALAGSCPPSCTHDQTIFDVNV